MSLSHYALRYSEAGNDPVKANFAGPDLLRTAAITPGNILSVHVMRRCPGKCAQAGVWHNSVHPLQAARTNCDTASHQLRTQLTSLPIAEQVSQKKSCATLNFRGTMARQVL